MTDKIENFNPSSETTLKGVVADRIMSEVNHNRAASLKVGVEPQGSKDTASKQLPSQDFLVTSPQISSRNENNLPRPGNEQSQPPIQEPLVDSNQPSHAGNETPLPSPRPSEKPTDPHTFDLTRPWSVPDMSK